jgi:5-enolpyruvylshikimate-3-phosphate synthase
MTLGVAGLLIDSAVTINGSEAASVSYPSFWADVRLLAGKAASA